MRTFFIRFRVNVLKEYQDSGRHLGKSDREPGAKRKYRPEILSETYECIALYKGD